jgi:hypothetical protein
MGASLEKKRSGGGAVSPTGAAGSVTQLGTVHDVQNLEALGYKAELRRNRSMFTLLFQSLAIAAVSIPSEPCRVKLVEC